MASPILSLQVLAFILSCAPQLNPEPPSQLVVVIARSASADLPATDAGATAGTHSQGTFRDSAPRALTASWLDRRFGPLGLSARRCLADGLPAPIGEPSAANPFALDPARVWLLEACDSLAARAAALELARDPAIEWVEFNQTRTAALKSLDAGFPGEPLFRDGRQWGLRNLGPAGVYGGIAGADIHAREAWELSTGSNEVRLAVADTGIDPSHPELQARLNDGSMRIELGVNVTDPQASFADSLGHGTAVTGVMAALSGEGVHFDSLGIAGVCGGDGRGNGGCHIVPIKISTRRDGSATSFDIARAMLYASSVGARAMNLSYAGSGPSRVEHAALYHAITHGCMVVAASGNRGDANGTAPQYPAAYAAEGLCIQVGASDPSDQRARFSSYGPGLDVVAPGIDIWTTFPTYPNSYGFHLDGYVAGSGTSFAAPFVTGTIGLLAARRPELQDADFQHIIGESADDVGDAGVDAETGWGRLDAAATLRSVNTDVGIWHDEVPADRMTPGPLDTLRIGERGPGLMSEARLWPDSQLIEASVSVTLPDSFLAPVRVWPRIGGTMTVRDGFRLPTFTPWAEVTAIGATSFTLRGYLYRVSECPIPPECPEEDLYLPLPPDQIRLGFTVIGRVDRPPSLELLSPTGPIEIQPGDTLNLRWRARDPDQLTAFEIAFEEDGQAPARLARVGGDEVGTRITMPCALSLKGPARLRITALDEHGKQHDQSSVEIPITIKRCPRGEGLQGRLIASPNPFRGSITIGWRPSGVMDEEEGPMGQARLSVHDISGRRVCRAGLDLGPTGFVWDGRDQESRPLPPGLYVIDVVGASGRFRIRVVKLEDSP